MHRKSDSKCQIDANNNYERVDIDFSNGFDWM